MWKNVRCLVLIGAALSFVACDREPATPPATASATAPVVSPIPARSMKPEFGDIADVLRPRAIVSDQYRIGVSPEMLAITKKAKAAIEADPEWWAKYQEQPVGPSGARPYDPKMGVTEEEYRRVLSKDPNDAFLEVAAHPEFQTKVAGEGRFVFVAPPQWKIIDGISVDLVNGLVSTQFGALDSPSEFKDGPLMNLGQWSGYQWQHNFERGEGDWVLVNFYVGRLKSNGHGVVYYFLTGPAGSPMHELRFLVEMRE